AMLVTARPRILALEPGEGLHAQDVMDFWRPNYRQEALVDGKYSAHMYMHTALKCWERYAAATGRCLETIDKFCYHLPFTRMARKAHAHLLKNARGREPDAAEVDRHIADSLHYGRGTGNSYAASIFQGLACLLDHAGDDLSGRRIGFFSYGSGCTGEFFSGVVQGAYRSRLLTERHRRLLADRVELDYEQYKALFTRRVPTDGGVHAFPRGRAGPFRLAGIRHHKRIYERVEDHLPER
ncbi:MAG: hydroxymethylglutaryl-CoA synthase, partial [Myxococcota bacterium]